MEIQPLVVASLEKSETEGKIVLCCSNARGLRWPISGVGGALLCSRKHKEVLFMPQYTALPSGGVVGFEFFRKC